MELREAGTNVCDQIAEYQVYSSTHDEDDGEEEYYEY